MTYYETVVEVNGIKYTIKPGDSVIKDGVEYIFQWCTSQFERYIDTSRSTWGEPIIGTASPGWCLQMNVEGGFYKVDAVKIKQHEA